MKYMVIETFAPGKRSLVYERFQPKAECFPMGYAKSIAGSKPEATVASS